jgi:hypothetical protein
MTELQCVCTHSACANHAGRQCLKPISENEIARDYLAEDKNSGGLICAECSERIRSAEEEAVA